MCRMYSRRASQCNSDEEALALRKWRARRCAWGMPWLGGLLYRGDGISGKLSFAHCPMIGWINNGGVLGWAEAAWPCAHGAPTLYGSWFLSLSHGWWL
jgi:hypothetical protein